MSKILTYDGTFNGFLSTIFDIYDYKIEDVIIKKNLLFTDELFADNQNVITDPLKAKRVIKGLKNIIESNGISTLHFAFQSEIESIENTLLSVIKYAFSEKQNIMNDYAHQEVLKASQTARKVGREKHRMEAFVRFQQTKDNIFFSNIEPDFNVLPLIKKHFQSRYADQKWIIYDLNRHYGLFYDLHKTENIYIDFTNSFSSKNPQYDWLSEEEQVHQTLWKDYFKNTNIEERINTSLHIKHVPKRYWKYLIEKN